MNKKWDILNKKWKNIIKSIVFLGFFAVLTYSLLLVTILLGSVDDVQGEPDIMIILGCQVTVAGPSQSLEDRLKKGLEMLEQFPEMVIIVSGGQGSNEPTTEAKAMADFLVSAGVPERQIYQEGNSSNTHQNLSFALNLMENEGLEGDILIVSSGFHLTRASFLWDRVGGSADELSVAAAPVTHWPSWIKSHLREPLAVVKSFIFDHGQAVLLES